MQLTCRAEHAEQLDDWFTESLRDSEGQVTLMEYEADYAYGLGTEDPDLPTNIPYYGTHGDGADYGPGAFACNGNELRYVQTGPLGYDIRFDSQTGEPNQADIEAVRSFIQFQQSVERMLEAPLAPLSVCPAPQLANAF